MATDTVPMVLDQQQGDAVIVKPHPKTISTITSFADLSLDHQGADMLTGYEEERFVEQPVEKYFCCGICLEVLREPVTCPGEHAFCYLCLNLHLNTSTTCPTCGVDITRDSLRRWNRVLIGLLHDKKLHCIYRERGCNTVMALEHIDSHEASCPFADPLQPVEIIETSFHYDEGKDQPSIEGHPQGTTTPHPFGDTHQEATVGIQRGDDSTDTNGSETTDTNGGETIGTNGSETSHDGSDGSDAQQGEAEHHKGLAAAPASASDNHLGPDGRRREKVEVALDVVDQFDVRLLQHMFFDPARSTPAAVLSNCNRTLSSREDDSVANSRSTTLIVPGSITYFEARLDSMWDPQSSDGTLRVGVACADSNVHSANTLPLGDNSSSIAWFDDVVDGLVYAELSAECCFREGDTVGVLMHLHEGASWMRLCVNGFLVGHVPVPCASYFPAFHCRSSKDVITILVPETVPLSILG
eukprot:m.482409 g.482409  ORF g.482409 m.482409 type:complete len:469 (-) comp22535_c0_seq1:262-1668(-)